jgi:hypothetical protein
MANHLLYQDEWKWGSFHVMVDDNNDNNEEDVSSSPTGTLTTNRWEWLSDGKLMNMNRVQSTLLHFPDWEALVPDPLEAIEESLLDITQSQQSVVKYPEHQDANTNPKDSNDDDDDNRSGGSNSNASEDNSGEDEDGDDEIMESSRNDDARARASRAVEADTQKINISNRAWVGLGLDPRYNPAFVLPLVLHALRDSHAPIDASNTSTTSHTTAADDGDEDTDPDLAYSEEEQRLERLHKVYSHLKVVQSLCSNGALALTLASLASKCDSMRQLAVAILLFMTQAVHMEEARDLTDWRDRRQLAMLLNSIQRGLCYRRWTQLAKREQDREEEEEDDDDETMEDVNNANRASSKSKQAPAPDVDVVTIPLFSSVSAIFLARASIVLGNPSDPMYDVTNSYFLGLSKDKLGAFRDSGLRLPAFLYLYNGSISQFASNGNGIGIGGMSLKIREMSPKSLIRQRIWAVMLLRDGARDGFSVKAALKCNAPSMLLCQLNNIMMLAHSSSSNNTNEVAETTVVDWSLNALSEKEQGVTLETLNVMLQYGGNTTALHFHQQLGILSWLRIYMLKTAGAAQSRASRGKGHKNLRTQTALLSLVSTSLHSLTLYENDPRLSPATNATETSMEVGSLCGPLSELLLVTLTTIEECDDNTNDALIRQSMEAVVSCLEHLRIICMQLISANIIMEQKDVNEQVNVDNNKDESANPFMVHGASMRTLLAVVDKMQVVFDENPGCWESACAKMRPTMEHEHESHVPPSGGGLAAQLRFVYTLWSLALFPINPESMTTNHRHHHPNHLLNRIVGILVGRVGCDSAVRRAGMPHCKDLLPHHFQHVLTSLLRRYLCIKTWWAAAESPSSSLGLSNCNNEEEGTTTTTISTTLAMIQCHALCGTEEPLYAWKKAFRQELLLLSSKHDHQALSRAHTNQHEHDTSNLSSPFDLSQSLLKWFQEE